MFNRIKANAQLMLKLEAFSKVVLLRRWGALSRKWSKIQNCTNYVKLGEK